MARTGVAHRNDMLDTHRAKFNNGYLRIFDGTRPTDSDTPLSGNNLLAELRFAATAFAAASGGQCVAADMTDEDAALATGTASFARAYQSDGSTAICDLSVGVGSGEVQMSSLSIAAGVAVADNVSSVILSMGVGT